ncbi:MAG: right-handed parallel beta-helix repeat-containing protein [Anaerolineae bacterium]
MENNEFIGNVASRFGGAVVVNIHANPIIRFNTFVDNRAGQSGGAMVINDNSRVVLQSNTIAGNRANVAAGVLVMNDASSQITDNTISRNVATEHGGGIYVTDSNARMTGNQIVDNQAGGLGGGAVVINAAPAFENNLVSGNRANSGGAGFFINNSQATLRHNSIVRNGRNQNGDGVLLAASASPALIYNVIVGNDYGIRSGGGQPRQSTRNNLFDNRLGDYLGVTPGASDLRIDPKFYSGPRGAYYLAQTSAGQASNSPLVDACAETAQALGLHLSTTRTDGRNDQGLADIGYHFKDQPNRMFLPVVRLRG